MRGQDARRDFKKATRGHLETTVLFITAVSALGLFPLFFFFFRLFFSFIFLLFFLYTDAESRFRLPATLLLCGRKGEHKARRCVQAATGCPPPFPSCPSSSACSEPLLHTGTCLPGAPFLPTKYTRACSCIAATQQKQQF